MCGEGRCVGRGGVWEGGGGEIWYGYWKFTSEAIATLVISLGGGDTGTDGAFSTDS